MNPNRPFAVIFALLCVPGPAFAQSPAAPPAQSPAQAVVFPTQRLVRQVARGVEMVQEIVPDGSADGPLVITVLRIDPRAPGVRIEAALGQDRVWGNDPTFGREIVSTLAQRHKAVAGINAGFFPFAGNPIGLHIQDGEMVTEPAKERTVFLLPQNGRRAQFRAFAYKGAVRTESGTAFALDGLNRKADKSDNLLLYTPIFADQTLKASGRVEVVLSGVNQKIAPSQEVSGKIESVTEGGGTAIARGTVILSGAGDGAAFLRAAPVGSKLTFRLDVTPVLGSESAGSEPFDAATIKEAVAGAPRILTNGKVTIRLKEEAMGTAFSTTRHPRTAVGQTPDGRLLFVTVDGRQKGLSRGASLEELAQILLKQGATEAVNLDGGGSSALVVRDRISSSPSEGIERPIANALLVYADNLPVSPAGQVALAAPARTLQVGETWPLARTEITAQSGVWGTLGGVGFVDQKGEFRAMRPGKGEVRLSFSNGKFISAPVTVIGKSASDAAGFGAKLSLNTETNNRATLTVHIVNAEGDPLGGEVAAVAVTGGRPDSGTVTTDRKGDARVGINWDKTAATRRVSVSSPAKRFAPASVSPNR